MSDYHYKISFHIVLTINLWTLIDVKSNLVLI